MGFALTATSDRYPSIKSQGRISTAIDMYM